MRRALLSVFLAMTMWAADISGEWTFEVMLDAGSGSPSFTFQQKGDTITGKYKGQLGESDLKGTVTGDKIRFSFKLEQGGEAVVVEYDGVIESATAMKGSAKYGAFASGTWKAARK